MPVLEALFDKRKQKACYFMKNNSSTGVFQSNLQTALVFSSQIFF